MQVVTCLETHLEELTQQLVAVQQERDAARGAINEAVSAEQRAQARLEEQRKRLTDLHRQVEAQATELAQAHADLIAQAKIAGEVEALRRQVTEQSTTSRTYDLRCAILRCDMILVCNLLTDEKTNEHRCFELH